MAETRARFRTKVAFLLGGALLLLALICRLIEERAMADAPFDISLASSVTPPWFSLQANVGPHAGTITEFTVNADGSVWVSDWTTLPWWQSHIQTNDPTFAVLTLLLAARGHIREVDADERDRIARDAVPPLRITD